MDEQIALLKQIGDIIYTLQDTLLLEEEAAELEALSRISEQLILDDEVSDDDKKCLKNKQEALQKTIEERRKTIEEQRGNNKTKEDLENALDALKDPKKKKKAMEDFIKLISQ